MGSFGVLWRNNTQKSYLSKISIPRQIMFEILAQLCPDDSVQILPCKSFRANPSRLSEVKERLEGPKYNIYLGGGGGGGGGGVDRGRG